MFTGFEDAAAEKAVRELGGFVTADPRECTVLVTDKVRRTAKFMCAMGRGMPIVSHVWITQIKMTKTFLGKPGYFFSSGFFLNFF